MKVNILASGSKGNCIALTAGSTTILIDAGIPKTKIEKRLLEVGIRADQVAAIFITHAHGDHIKGVSLANKYRIPVYASFEEWKDIDQKVKLDSELHNIIKDEPIVLDYEGYAEYLQVTPFNIHHDAYDPKGFVIDSAVVKCSVCLDTGHVDDDMLQAMQSSDIYIMEANHHPPLVEVCDRPPSIKARILSNEVGHLSNKQTADALSQLVQGAQELIYITHLSEGNNIPQVAQGTIENALKRKGFTNGEHYTLEVIA